jgi:hypothetical protein
MVFDFLAMIPYGIAAIIENWRKYQNDVERRLDKDKKHWQNVAKAQMEVGLYSPEMKRSLRHLL